MGQLINIAPLADKETKLKDVLDYLEEIKNSLAEIIEEYEDDNNGTSKADTLTDALDALEDAFDAINDVVIDEV